jgi:hypothetical protein
MSRLVIFGPDNKSVGEIHANCSRGWAISEGGQATVTLRADDALNKWLQFGRMVLVEHEKLPPWAGMIDTPWTATIPGQMTLYNAEYLLSVRAPDNILTLTGTTGGIALQMINLANAQEDLYIREGKVDASDSSRQEVFDQRSFFEQLTTLGKNAGREMRFRPERVDRRLIIRFDLQPRIGVVSDQALRSGADGNLEITEARIDGEIYNRIIGIGDETTQDSRLQTRPFTNATSISRYRMRSRVTQYSGVADLSVLEANVATELAEAAFPKLILTANVLDIGDTFSHLDLGNTYPVHAPDLYLPGGIHGWGGTARITAMVYDETNNKVQINLEAAL